MSCLSQLMQLQCKNFVVLFVRVYVTNPVMFQGCLLYVLEIMMSIIRIVLGVMLAILLLWVSPIRLRLP